jgi:SAM-dependent methyltransferase
MSRVAPISRPSPIPPTRVGDRVPPGRAYPGELDATVTDVRQVRGVASPYDAIAELYDPWSRSVTEDVDFYVSEARRAGGPVVELGIGTGRIAIPIAQKGIRVIGVDSSREMLAACRRRADREDVAELLDLRLGDLRAPQLDEPVPLVICPFRSYLHLVDDGERVEALTAARAALAPAGRLAFDVFAPKPDDIAETHGRWLEREPGIYELAEWDESARTLTLSVRGPSGAATMALSWISREEWQHLLEETGFTVEACYGWFDRTPFRGGEDMIFMARTV